jgi:hypothetical protein
MCSNLKVKIHIIYAAALVIWTFFNARSLSDFC